MQEPAERNWDEIAQQMLRDPRLTTVAEIGGPLLQETYGYDDWHAASVAAVEAQLGVDYQEACLWVAMSRHLLFPALTTSNRAH